MSPSSYFAHLLDPVAHQRALLPSLSSLAKCRPQPSRIPRSHLEFQLTAGNQMEEPAGAACTLAIASIFEQGSLDWSHRSMNTTPSGHCSWVKKRLAGLPLPISSISVHFSLVMNQICEVVCPAQWFFRARKPKDRKTAAATDSSTTVARRCWQSTRYRHPFAQRSLIESRPAAPHRIHDQDPPATSPTCLVRWASGGFCCRA